ncbi:ATP-dependent RecD-like DNA helicase [Idiomarina sp. M1R2S28]|uniref:ATP-dependent RecD-like DNA helicase n=1 Tax=Idiomarina rhizosphaerae TaxID=2961572 RepID=A0A9X2FWG6_9GAMM|nr:ATP-dependent RecD-like DNA helicase [Idiomarina rhizosphaerae]MCP1339275.1 ATP-dependent RecD-like DNA helicase [Idiomarina rhizosphaerae]
MTTINEQIMSADYTISQNIDRLTDQRDLLSQNILSQLRNLVEGVVVLFNNGALDNEFNYDLVNPSIRVIKSDGRLNFLTKFHRLLQISVSHYTVDGDSSERLMLKYYEYLHRIRDLLRNRLNIQILANLELFPVDLDPSLREYHEKIANKIDAHINVSGSNTTSERYYIHKKRPFFCFGRIYYEVTFYRAINKSNKFDRIIAFTHFDIADKHAAMLTLQRESIQVLGQTMPITVIRGWRVSIRPCEFDNFAKSLGVRAKVRTNSSEYSHVMQCLTSNSESLLDFVLMSDNSYSAIKLAATSKVKAPQIFPILDKARGLVKANSQGHNIIRYLLLRMNNQIIKAQYSRQRCYKLSNLNFAFSCIPFDEMPFCTSLYGHNPRFIDIVESIDATGRSHEILARKVKTNVERHGILYTSIADFPNEDVAALIREYNSRLYYLHGERKLVCDKGHIFECGYENQTVSIIEKLQENTGRGIAGYKQAVEKWLNENPRLIDDPTKAEALKQLFCQSCVALIYGAAGTGKTTMVHHIAQYFNEKKKLFLAHTNPATDNLKRRVNAQNAEFKTIRKQIKSPAFNQDYDLLIIDESSTVSNADLIKVLENTSFKLLVFVGDIYQIESIQFGNWFSVVPSFIPNSSIFELKTPYRTQSDALLRLWSSVRASSDDIAEIMAKNSYSTLLDSSLFESQSHDEIILCLNYDGLYGINNINRFLQSGNQGQATMWRESTFKVGDPVLFSDSERFRPVIYNNLKGWIVAIAKSPGWIQFDVELDRPLSEFDVCECDELDWISGSIVRFTVYDYPTTSDEDDDSYNTTIPFQVAYAVSIHKAQGLEYDSVKIVVTDSNEDDISHSIFYTAITRTRDRLKVFWTPETQQKVIERLARKNNSKDVSLLLSRRNLNRVS